MIYGIRVQDYVLREISRQVDREGNQLFFTLLFDVQFDTDWSAEKATSRKAFGFNVRKTDRESLWKLLKDATNRELITHLHTVLSEAIDEFAAFLSYEQNPEYEDQVQGKGQAPVSVRKANPHQGVLSSLEGTVFEGNTPLLTHLVAIEPDSSAYNLVELGE